MPQGLPQTGYRDNNKTIFFIFKADNCEVLGFFLFVIVARKQPAVGKAVCQGLVAVPFVSFVKKKDCKDRRHERKMLILHETE